MARWLLPILLLASCSTPSGDLPDADAHSLDLAVGEACLTGFECESGVCLHPGDGALCAQPCLATGCDLDGWSCRGLIPTGRSQPLNLCAPPVTDVFDLPPGAKGDYTLSIGTDVSAFQITAVGRDPSVDLQIVELIHPEAGPIAGQPNARGVTTPFRTTANPGQCTVVMPQNRRFGATPGTWRFQVQGGDVERVVVQLRRGEIPARVAYDLDIGIAAGLTGLDADSAPSEPRMRAALQRIQDRLGVDSGVALGKVRYHDLPTAYVTLDDEAEMRQMIVEESAMGEPGALKVFLVGDLLDLGEGALGRAGGLPGSVGIPGTPGSGIVVQLTDDGQALGDSMLHELGHLLGLYHVTERDGGLDDVIEDTPGCDVAPDQLTDYAPCMDNIMFPQRLTELAIPQAFSPTQLELLRAHPVAQKP